MAAWLSQHNQSCALIGMVHVHAMPGAAASHLSIDEIVGRAANDAQAIASAGFDAVMIENMHDRPYVNGPHSPVVTSIMTRVALAVREAIGDLPLGVQVLSRGEREALAICAAAGGSFIRCENFAFAHVADEGLMADACAGELLRYRRTIGAEHIKVFADVKKKHACHAITSDLTIADAARGLEFFGADGIIVTGTSTSTHTDVDDVAEVRSAVSCPVLVGSGAAPDTLASLSEYADGVIVGSWIKQDGFWEHDVDPARACAMVQARDAIVRS